jgi:hypothetical protein
VAARHFVDLEDLAPPIRLGPADLVATAGSCFAQHIGENLRRRGAHYLDAEPAPAGWAPADARRHGFGIVSARYGNIYTSRQLLQLAEEALGRRVPRVRVWEKDGRFFDALRPSVDPAGHADEAAVLRLRENHLAAVRRLLADLDVLVFTLGLTETWEARGDGTAYPVAPGTLAGEFDPARYRFLNLHYPDIHADMTAFRALLREINPGARMILTVSPVPLTATASGGHVLVASSYSKSVLRAVAGDLAADHEDVAYFPSYEIIASHPGRAMFFNPDLRSVNLAGVDYVMRHFFRAAGGFGPAVEIEADEPICDEEKLERYAAR